MPKVGDLLIQKVDGQNHVGFIYSLSFPKARVFVRWAGKAPNCYNSEYGYSPTNIHNQPHVFSLVKT